MGVYVVATIKSWNIERFQTLKESYSEHEWHLITNKGDLTLEALEAINPDKIFFPHWSWIIPSSIFERFTCVVFHMTDLPFGRGGSPLQNLLSRGIHQTKISALRVEEGLDTGPIYLKRDLDISYGNATDIFTRGSRLVFEMIGELAIKEIEPVAQQGEAVCFSRRKPEQSVLPDEGDLTRLYDHIRMLDGEGYPAAFLDYGKFRFLITNAIKKDGSLHCSVEIKEINSHD